MIIPRHARHLPIPGYPLAAVFVQNPDPRSLAKATPLTRMSEGQFDILTAARRDETGQPMYWTVREDGRGEVWPLPDRDYTLRARDSAGRDPDQVRKPVTVFPVAETVEAVNRQMDDARTKEEQDRAGRQAQAPEYFRRPPQMETE